LRDLRHLRRVHLESMKGLRDLAPVAAAPNLEELVVVDAAHMEVDDFRAFTGHPQLRAARVGLASVRRNEEVAALLALPDIEDPFEFAGP
jgi:hypothetical protein